jgi:hypothetical protein
MFEIQRAVRASLDVFCDPRVPQLSYVHLLRRIVDIESSVYSHEVATEATMTPRGDGPKPSIPQENNCPEDAERMPSAKRRRACAAGMMWGNPPGSIRNAS